MEDVVRALGFLTLGSRFKRIGERLQADTQQVLDALDVGVAASQYPLLAALDRLGPLTIGELAQAVGVAQPGVTRSLASLSGFELVETAPASDDLRRRIVSLTQEGRRLVEIGKREVWPRVERAVAELCGERGTELLDQLTAIEDGLAAAPLARRVATSGSAA